MTRQEMIADVDQEIERLESIRALLAKSTGQRFAVPASTAAPARGKRTMSPEARQRIALAQKRRWAKQKRAAGPAKK